jgi:hypothetical protein
MKGGDSPATTKQEKSVQKMGLESNNDNSDLTNVAAITPL